MPGLDSSHQIVLSENIVKQSGEFPNEVELLNLNKPMTVKLFGWKPPQRPQWVKEVMKTPGHIKIQLLLLTILTLSSVSSTVLQISRMGGSTSVVNISGSLELQGEKREK